MRAKTGDLVAAPIVALWAIVALPGWGTAGRLMTGNSMLLFIEPFVGLVLLTAVVFITFTALGLAVGLVIGSDRVRLQALALGMATGLSGLCYPLVGQMSTVTGHRWALGTWLLATFGGPIIVAAIVSGGELLPPPRRRRPAPPTLAVASSTPVTATAEDYWVQVASRPAPAPADLPNEPWWADLDAAGWILFGLCVSAILLGVYWLGGRWRSGPHPAAGFLLIASAIGIGWGMDRARKRARR